MEIEKTNYDFSPSERVYMLKLPQAVVAKTVPELQRTLRDGKPTIVFIHHQLTLTVLANAGLRITPDSQFEMPSKNGTPYPFLSFHGAETILHLRDRLGEACHPVPSGARQ